jgi:mannose-6-phosphate isomerase-like protein (cupin superfamily)
MPNFFTVVGAKPLNLDDLANELRAAIDKLPATSPQLAGKFLNQQTGVQTYLVVVRGHEDPHTHPDGDLVISVLEGGGHLRCLSGDIDAAAGSVVLVPKGVCHAYYNDAKGDSVILATFSPINSKADCPLIS